MTYLDNNASTPMAPTVKVEMAKAFDLYANPNGIYSQSKLAESLFESARTSVANSLNVLESEVIFTSGSTEAITLAIWGVLLAAPVSRSKVLVSSIEHSAIIETAKVACKITGKELIFIPANISDSSLLGEVDVDFIHSHLDAETALIAVMAVNNETGVIQPIESISRLAAEYDIPLLCDSTQALGKWERFLSLENRGIFMLSGHKIYGPKGVGILVLPRDLQKTFISVSPGGGQERGIRGGTLNLAGAVGIQAALEFVTIDLEQELVRQGRLRDHLLENLVEFFGESLRLNAGSAAGVVNNTLNLQFVGTDADAVLASLRSVQASRASACSAGQEEPSHVLIAMGRSWKEAEESIRLSLGRFTTNEDIDVASLDLVAAISRVREFNE